MRENIPGSINTNLPLELKAALEWLGELGIEYPHTRFGRYKKTLDKLEAGRLKIKSAIKLESHWVKNPNLYDAVAKLNASATLFEANELATIHQGLANRGLEKYLRPQLKVLVSGAASYVEEGVERSKARDTGFELAVMARLATAGFITQPDSGLADVVVRRGETTYIMECKRPQSDAGVYDAIRDARKQLDVRYQQMPATNPIGFIALDVTKLFNPELTVPDVVRPLEIISLIPKRMATFLDTRRRDFERVSDARTAGILVRYSVLAWAEASQCLCWLHHYGVAYA